MPTLKDIMEELDKPGRDPRSKIEIFEFDKSIHKLEDLRGGHDLARHCPPTSLPFGCFVDVGHQGKRSGAPVADG